MSHRPLHRAPRLACAPLVAVALLALAGCGTSSATSTTSAPAKPLIATDADGTPVVIPAQAPQRIISLGATDSEILGGLKLDTRVIGVDSFTDYPDSLTAKPKVTDANGAANVEQIVGLKPDLVLSYGGETKDADQKLEQAQINVVDLPAADLSQSLIEIRLVGQLTHEEKAANALVASMQQRIDAVKKKVSGATPVSVYMEVGYTPAPPYAFGGGSFGDELIGDAGGTNIFHAETANGGYPSVSDESIIKGNPQVVVLTEDPSYGGDPATVGARPGWSAISAVQKQRVYRIAPDIVQRPGPRIVDGLEQLAKDLHPELFS